MEIYAKHTESGVHAVYMNCLLKVSSDICHVTWHVPYVRGYYVINTGSGRLMGTYFPSINFEFLLGLNERIWNRYD